MSEEPFEPELIESAKAGDARAFGLLVLRYQSRVLKIITRYVKDPVETLDVSQEVFLKVFRSLPKFRGESAFYTWLYRIVINTSKNYLASQCKRLPDVDLEKGEVEHCVTRYSLKEYGSPERLMIRDQMEHLVYDVIEQLPAELRTAIQLREIEGLTYENIAEVMACPVGTVRSRISRARAAIDKSMQPFVQQ